jgi:hypothetical protein
MGSVEVVPHPLLSWTVLAEQPGVSTTLGWGCLAAGLILTAIGTWQRTVVVRLRANGTRTTAHAVDCPHHGPIGGPGAGHHLVWRFATADGTLVEHEDLASGLHHPSEGETAKIIYDPDDPHNARLETFAEGTLAWALFFTSGIILLVVAAVSGVVASTT